MHWEAPSKIQNAVHQALINVLGSLRTDSRGGAGCSLRADYVLGGLNCSLGELHA